MRKFKKRLKFYYNLIVIKWNGRAVHAGEAGIDKIQPLTVSNQNPNLCAIMGTW